MNHQGFVVKYKSSQYSLFGRKRPLLNHLDIELTERCNSACIHCYINLPARDATAISRELTTVQWKEIIRQTAELGALSVRFTGGEPLLRSDFPELYLFTRRLGMKVMLFTNARLITPELADLLARVPPLKKVEISSYGMAPGSYDAITCAPGSFLEFRRGVNLLSELRIPFMVKPVLLPANIDELRASEEWAATIIGINNSQFTPLLLDLRGRRDSPSRNRLIKSLRFSADEYVRLVTRDAQSYRNSISSFIVRLTGPQGDKLFACPAGQNGCVDAYGKYQLCMLLRHPQMTYDLGQGTMQEALTEVFPQLLESRATNPNYLARCARCFLKGLCEQCPGKAWQEHGTLDTPVEYLCEVAHAQARVLGLLQAREYAWETSFIESRKRMARLLNVEEG